MVGAFLEHRKVEPRKITYVDYVRHYVIVIYHRNNTLFELFKIVIKKILTFDFQNCFEYT